jgi:hypothetical protein
MNRKRLWLLYPVLALVLALCLAVPANAQEEPVPLPHNFYGSLTIGTELAPAGMEVEARGEGVMTGIEGNPITTTEEGKYGGPGPLDPKLRVQGYIDEGTPIEFYVDGVRAQCREDGTEAWLNSYPWHSDGMTELDLRVTVELVPPVVTTSAATDVTTSSANLNGSLDSLGDYTSVDVSFEWGDTEGGPYPNETPPEEMTSIDPFSAPISGLIPATTYYFRAKATGSVTVYGDELSFTTEEDITPPEVVSTWPMDGAGDVAIDTVVTATFSEPIDEGTIVFTLDGVSGSVSYSDTTATFTPDADLDYSTPYSASIQASDLAGNPMAEAHTWSFTTQGPPGTLSLVEGVNIIAYTSATADLPGALTNIGPGGLDVVDGIWARGAWTGGEWLYYNARIMFGTLSQLEAGRAYIIVVTEDCAWELP